MASVNKFISLPEPSTLDMILTSLEQHPFGAVMLLLLVVAASAAFWRAKH